MTKIQLEYDLLRAVDDDLLDQIARVHGVYGILHVRLAPTLDKLRVEYDATRLSALEMETVLRKAGLPVGVRA